MLTTKAGTNQQTISFARINRIGAQEIFGFFLFCSENDIEIVYNGKPKKMNLYREDDMEMVISIMVPVSNMMQKQ